MNTPEFYTFVVQIKRGPMVRLSFEAMAHDSVSCVEQHLCLCEVGEKMSVEPVRQETKR